MHRPADLPILYFGTPVAIISTMNEDGSANLAPMSSVWWLGQSCMLGLAQASQTSLNLVRERQAGINLPSANEAHHVDRLAMTTGRNPVPEYKVKMGYRYEPDKFEIGELTPLPSELVAPPRVKQCPVQMEAELHEYKPFGKMVNAFAFEMHIVRVHVEEHLLYGGEKDRVDPCKWNPLIMSFREFFSLGGKVRDSRLSEFPEAMFRKPRTA